MPLYGFLGRFPGPIGLEVLSDHGERVAASWTSRGAGSRASPTHACWGSQLASESDITVVIEGEPHWNGRALPAGESAAAEVLAAFKRVGERVLDSLSGRFALAIVDVADRRALLAVDPMGIERLAYAVRGPYLVFGTSAESVARCPAVAAPLALQAIFDYLLLHMVPAPRTIFSEVSKLRAGTCASFADGRLSARQYWRPRFAEDRRASFPELRASLRGSLRRAVADCRPDGHTGAFLSGGLDSSSVAGVLSEVGPPPARTFSIGFGYPQYDELPYARIAARHFRCEAHEYVIRAPDITAAFPLIARTYDEPFGNSSALPVYHCAKLALESGVAHLLAGDGGDELFAGNSRYAEQQVFERYNRIPSFLRREILEPVLRTWPEKLLFWPVRKARGYVNKSNVPLPARLETWNIINRIGADDFLHPEFRAAIDPASPYERMREVWDAAPSASTLHHMLYYDWQYTLADNDLRKVESMSALAGVRVSYPMLHPEVIDLSLRVPPSTMMPGTKLRHFYKQAMTGFLPDAIIRKKKHGFGLPFGLWLRESATLRELVMGNLSGLRSRRLVRAELLDRLQDLHSRDDASYYGVFIWVLAMLEQWFREHGVSP